MEKLLNRFRPILAPNNDPLKDPNYWNELKYPLLCSSKIDGIRMIVKEQRCKSRTYIDLPSNQVQALFSNCDELDGELIVGNETDFNVYNRTQSYVMSENKIHDDIKFRVFDWAEECVADMVFHERLIIANVAIAKYKNPKVSIVEHTLCNNKEELLEYEEKQLELGYEGVMMRNPFGRYKHGRGTFKEGLIYKLKRFQDDEAKIIGFIEQQTNTNEDIRSNLGGAKRSTAKAGMVLAGTLGKFVVDYNGLELEIGCGAFLHTERLWIWKNMNFCLGRILKFRFFGHGIKHKPRMPRAIGFRDKMDT